MKIHGYGPSSFTELLLMVIFFLLAFLTAPIWLPIWWLWKKFRGEK